MTMSWMPCCCFMRRDFARISPIVILGESSTINGACEILSRVRAMACQSRVSNSPLIMRSRNTFDSAASKRMDSSVRFISSEKYAEAMLLWTAAERQMSMARVDFPPPGRAAMMIIWPARSPLSLESNSEKPVGTPSSPPSRLALRSSSSYRSGTISSRVV